MSVAKTVGQCPCCGRRARLTLHHLIPKKMHRRPYFRKHFDKATLAQGVLICRQCHDGIHRFYSEMELAKRLSSLTSLQQDEQLATYFAWVSKQHIRLE